MILAMVVGLCAGVISGLLGVGGGILFVPALTLALSLSQVQAEATSLVAIVPVAAAGAVRHHRYGNVRLDEGLVLGGLSAVGVAGGVALANVLPQRALRLAFAAVMVAVAIEFLRRVWHERSGADADARGADRRPIPFIAMIDETSAGEGYAVSTLEAMGSGPGFRKIRHEVGVTAFGINAIVLPAGYESNVHYHDQQEETYFVHQGQVEFRFGDGSRHVLGPGGVARVDAATHRGMKNVGEGEAVVVVAGGKDGYVGRDGQPVGEGSRGDGPPGAGPPPGSS